MAGLRICTAGFCCCIYCVYLQNALLVCLCSFSAAAFIAMFIKAITLDGFKSYAQRTEISGFDPLFNAVTGLNGSGKSNILDGICFVLGITNLSQVLLLHSFIGPEGVPNSHDSCCCCCCCCDQFSKMSKAFLIRSRVQRNFAYTFVLTLAIYRLTFFS